jgi:hypothetical protein
LSRLVQHIVGELKKGTGDDQYDPVEVIRIEMI